MEALRIRWLPRWRDPLASCLMETLSVRCNHCGAPLQIGDGTRFVTCQFCQSHLEVKRTDSSIFTEEVAKIAENTGRMAESLEVIELQNEIERLDRELGPQAARHHDNPVGNAIGGCVGFVIVTLFISFSVFFAKSSSDMGAPAIFPIFGIGFVIVGILSGVGLLTKLASGPSEKQKRRAELVRKVEQLRKN